MTSRKTAEDFWKWCSQFGPTFHNSPDAHNLTTFLLKKKHSLTLDERRQVLDIANELRTGQKPAVKPITDADIFGDEAEESEEDMRNRTAKGRPAGTELLKELSLKTTQGKIVQRIIDEGTNNVDDLAEEFSINRHAVMSHLNVISRSTGIGYSVKDSIVTLTLPAGVKDPFEL